MAEYVARRSADDSATLDSRGRFGDNLIDWFGRSHSGICEYIDSLTDEELGEMRTDKMPGGQSREMRLWDMMLHVVNHGTQHRSEVAMMLTEMRRSPGEIDYVFFEIERAGA